MNDETKTLYEIRWYHRATKGTHWIEAESRADAVFGFLRELREEGIERPEDFWIACVWDAMAFEAYNLDKEIVDGLRTY